MIPESFLNFLLTVHSQENTKLFIIITYGKLQIANWTVEYCNSFGTNWKYKNKRKQKKTKKHIQKINVKDTYREYVGTNERN